MPLLRGCICSYISQWFWLFLVYSTPITLRFGPFHSVIQVPVPYLIPIVRHMYIYYSVFTSSLLSTLSFQSFKLKHPDSGQLVYAGVLEFTSPSPEAAYLPQWMMEHLGAKEGEEMMFEHVDLPKGKFVRLQPVSSAWLVSEWVWHCAPCVSNCVNYYRVFPMTWGWQWWNFSWETSRSEWQSF